LRFAICGIGHETNTYCKEMTPLTAFRCARGDAILTARGTETSLGGALATCDELGVEPVPIMVAGTQPSGIIERIAYEAMKQETLEGIASAMPIDGVFMDLHGAGVVDGIPDLEGDFVKAVRDLVGEATPIAATFDLHGNISQEMADAIDGVFACHQYPHIDLHERAAEAIQLMVNMLNEGFRPVLHVETVPMLMPTTTTFQGIGKAMLEMVLEKESTERVIDISWFHGFPYTDTEYVGSHIVVTTREDRAHAALVATDIAGYLWSKRESFRPLSLSAADALTEAMAKDGQPIVINETSDNCGGGTRVTAPICCLPC